MRASTTIAALIVALAVSVAAHGQPGAPAANERFTGWSASAGYETFSLRDISRNTRPPDSSALAEEWLAAIQNCRVPHEAFMRAALAEAVKAGEAGEVPIGAVVVIDGRITGAGFNQPITAHDPTAHAEVIALRAAAAAVDNYRLTGATIYVTVEPCLMCVGAMVHARIGLVVFGAAEPKAGAIVSMTAAHELAGLNHRLETLGGVLETDCRDLLQEFFKSRRSDRRNGEP